jgi:hypothetical protein
MKPLEILIVGRGADGSLEDDDQAVTTAPGADAAVELLAGRGLGFDAVVLEPEVEDDFLDELRQHRETANVAVVRVYDAKRPEGYDATLHSGYGRRELRDAVHYAMGRRGLMKAPTRSHPPRRAGRRAGLSA